MVESQSQGAKNHTLRRAPLPLLPLDLAHFVHGTRRGMVPRRHLLLIDKVCRAQRPRIPQELDPEYDGDGSEHDAPDEIHDTWGGVGGKDGGGLGGGEDMGE